MSLPTTVIVVYKFSYFYWGNFGNFWWLFFYAEKQHMEIQNPFKKRGSHVGRMAVTKEGDRAQLSSLTRRINQVHTKIVCTKTI